MKDQTSPTAAEIVPESTHVHEDQVAAKKLHDVTGNNVESDGDSGIINVSNISLDTCEDHSINHNNNNSDDNVIEEDESDVPNWKLNIPPRPDEMSNKMILNFLAEANKELSTMPEHERREHVLGLMRKYYGGVLPESLLEIGVANMIEGDNGVSMDTKPDWLDMEKYKRGQKFALDHHFGIAYSELLSLFTVFSFQHGLKPLIVTGQSSTPYTAFKRYLSTGARVRNWYTYDPWTPNTPAYNDIKAVRRMHALVRKNLSNMSVDEYNEKSTIKNVWCPSLEVSRRDFESTCPAPKIGQCPYTIFIDNPGLRDKDLNQGQMSLTQFAFTGLLILNPKFFGCHDATEEDLEAFCHVWRGIGYLLGIDDEYNFCRGTLEDIRVRSRNFLDYWVKPNYRTIHPECEHMMRCMIEGLQYYFPGSTYETCLLDLAEILNMHMPRFTESLSYSLWFKRNFIRFYFDYACRISGCRALMNNQLNRSLDKALKFDEKKHKELQEKSERTLSEYSAEKAKKASSPVASEP